MDMRPARRRGGALAALDVDGPLAAEAVVVERQGATYVLPSLAHRAAS